MDFRFSPEDELFRLQVEEFLRQELPPGWEGGGRHPEESDWGFTRGMRKKLAQKGWLTMQWPEEYGGQAASHVRSAIFSETMTYNRAPGRDIFGVRMMGPTLMIYGTEEQKKEFLVPVSRGEVQWCQGYSEPGSGSDLASLQTRAVADGDDYVVNGSKIWTTMAHRADWIMVLTRTDPDAPKHRGISFLLVNMRTPGITVQPIHNMSGDHDFNQVFFDNVRVPKRNLVGEENRGWYVGVTLLDFERSGIDYSANSRRLLHEMIGHVKQTPGNGESISKDPPGEERPHREEHRGRDLQAPGLLGGQSARPGPGTQQRGLYEQSLRLGDLAAGHFHLHGHPRPLWPATPGEQVGSPQWARA